LNPGIAEPTTMVTDYMVAGLAVLFWWRLRLDADARQSVAEQWWSRAFLATALAAIAGGTTHGFAPILSETAWTVLWKATIYLLAVASLCLLLAALISIFSRRALKILVALACAKFFGYIGFLTQVEDLSYSHFDYVIYEYGFSMALIFLLQIWDWWRHRSAAAPWIMAGILVSAVASQIQMSRLGLHRHFNHNDIFHVVQMLTLWLLYRGGLHLASRTR
jgi:hypothetical protein